MKKNIIIAVSSTGGHIYPGLALAGELKKNGYDVTFVGKKSEIILREGYSLFTISARGLKRKSIFGMISFFAACFAAGLQSAYILAKTKPALVVGFGGYISFPVIVVARMLGIRSIIHEQNFIPGLANKYSARFADKICVSFQNTGKYFPAGKTVFTGDPVRKSILDIKRETRPADGPVTVLVFGGSQGARGINSAMAEKAERFAAVSEKLKLIHITGEKDFENVKSAYERSGLAAEVHEYLFDIEKAYKRCSLAVCRAGATTIAELIALKLPAILVPYPHSTENHQKANADFLKGYGCALVIEEKDISSLPDAIIGLVDSPQILDGMAGAYSKIKYPDPIAEFMKLISSFAR